MRYRFEYNGNPDFVTLHVSKRLIAERYACLSLSDSLSPETVELLQLIASVDGVDGGSISVSIQPYSVCVAYAKAFTSLEVLESLLATVMIYLQSRFMIAENEPLVKGEDIRSDIKNMMCPECQRIQEAEMKELYRDMGE